MPKYKLIKDKESSLYRIQALDYINTISGYKISPGDYGGLVSSAENLDQEGNCWITYNAKVIDNAFVAGNAVITGNAVVSENAQVFDNVIVYNNAYIYGHATLSGNARIYNYAQIFDHALIADNAEIHHYVQVFKNGCVVGNAILNGDVQFTGMVARTIDKSNEIKINHLNTEIMATQSKSEEKKEKNIVGSAFVKEEFTAPNGQTYKLFTPEYGIVLDANKLANIEANKAGNISLSIYIKRDADELKKEGRPTCYVAENTYNKDKQIDVYSRKDIVVNKDELLKLALKEHYNKVEYNRVYVNINRNGEIKPSPVKYDTEKVPEQITGQAYEVNRVERQELLYKQQMKEDGVKFTLDNIGSAWQQPGQDAAWYNMSINLDKAKYLPTDDDGMVHFSLQLNNPENLGANKAPTHIIVPNQQALTGRISLDAVKDFTVKKSELLSKYIAIEDKVKINEKEYTRRSAYLNITEDNRVVPNKLKYPGLYRDGYELTNAIATPVDLEARKAELERRKSIAAKNTKEEPQKATKETKETSANDIKETKATKESKTEKKATNKKTTHKIS